jgi:hypothetical protein
VLLHRLFAAKERTEPPKGRSLQSSQQAQAPRSAVRPWGRSFDKSIFLCSKCPADERPQAAPVANLLLLQMASEEFHRARDCGVRVLECATQIPTPHRYGGTQ